MIRRHREDVLTFLCGVWKKDFNSLLQFRALSLSSFIYFCFNCTFFGSPGSLVFLLFECTLVLYQQESNIAQS